MVQLLQKLGSFHLTAGIVEGVTSILHILLQNPEAQQTFIKMKGWQALFALNGDVFQGMLAVTVQMLQSFVEDEELVELTIENEVRFLLSQSKNMDFEVFLRHFKKYAKSKKFLEVTEKICVIAQDDASIKSVKLKDKTFNQGKFQPKAVTLNIVQLLVEHCQHSLQNALEGKPKGAFSYNLMLKCIHVLIRNYPVLTHCFVKQNCAKYFKKNPSLCLPSQNCNFLSFLLRAVVYVSGDRLRHLLYEICLDKSHGSAASLRQKLLLDLYEVLQTESKSDQFLKTPQSQHVLATYASLHTYLMSHRETSRQSINQLFLPLYSQLLLKLPIRGYYQYQQLVPFLLQPLSILH